MAITGDCRSRIRAVGVVAAGFEYKHYTQKLRPVLPPAQSGAAMSITSCRQCIRENRIFKRGLFPAKNSSNAAVVSLGNSSALMSRSGSGTDARQRQFTTAVTQTKTHPADRCRSRRSEASRRCRFAGHFLDRLINPSLVFYGRTVHYPGPP